jgi:hypothetical protein
MSDYVCVSFDVVDDWDEDTDTDLHKPEVDDWILDAETLRLFAENGISIPPKVPEVARLLVELCK